MADKDSASRPIPDKQEKLQRLIECSICLSELQDPRMLTCRHALCYTCLKDYVARNQYDKKLPCPVCREATALFEGGVDNLPKFFFMNELKEVVMEEDKVKEETPQKPRPKGVACSTEDCEEVALIYCTEGCDFQCHQCVAKHNKFKGTKSHKVIGVSEYKEFIKRDKPPYPPCRRHKHQLVDMFCLKCREPMCSTCSVSVHDGHKRCELERQGVVCKKKLKETSERTDRLIDQVKESMVKTKQQAQQAEIDIDKTCEEVKSTFKAIHEKLNQEEKKMLLNIQQVRRSLKKVVDVTIDSQAMTLASLESVKSCQVKLTDTNKAYEYVTSTESLLRDLENHVTDLQGFTWNSKVIKKSKPGEMIEGNVEIKQSELVQEKREEVGRIRLHNQDKPVQCMVVYRSRVYAVHYTGLVVYCYNPDGSLSEKYEHKGGAKTVVQGMCLMIHGGTASLVVSDWTNKALVWITVSDGGALKHHHTQQLQYRPKGLYNDRGHLVLCNPIYHKIHHYTGDGQPLNVITLPVDVNPGWVARHGDGEKYIVTDWTNHQVAVITREGRVKTKYKDDIHGVKLESPFAITTDKQGRILVADNGGYHVLRMSRDEEEVEQLLKGQVNWPGSVCLDEGNHRMYVAAKDMDDQRFVFIYDYILLTGGKTFTEKITKLDMVTVL